VAKPVAVFDLEGARAYRTRLDRASAHAKSKSKLTGHRDVAPGPVGPGEPGMGCGRSIDALTRLGQPRDDTAGGEIDVQIHQLLGGGPLSALEVEHFMRQMQALAVGPKDLRRDPNPLADQ